MLLNLQRKKKVHISWYKYFGLPPPLQPTGSSTETTTAALIHSLSGNQLPLIPTVTRVCCHKAYTNASRWAGPSKPVCDPCKGPCASRALP